MEINFFDYTYEKSGKIQTAIKENIRGQAVVGWKIRSKPQGGYHEAYSCLYIFNGL